MNAFFVAFVVLGCALSAQSIPNPSNGSDGGVFAADDSYIPGSVLVWCGIAENAEAYASPVGVGLLKNWYTASTTFDLTLNQPNPDYDSAKHTLNQANNCFCDVAKYISKQDLADFFAQVCRDFGDILARGDFSETQGYMMNAYPQFQTLTA